MNGFNFTERVRGILLLARDAATKRRHEYVDTEHILLGLIDEGEGVGASVLRSLGVNNDDLRQFVSEKHPPGRSDPSKTDVQPYTRSAKEVLERSTKEARRMDHSYVGTEHILLGLLAEEKGVAALALNAQNITIDRVRAEVVQILGNAPPDVSILTAVADVAATDWIAAVAAHASRADASRKARSYSMEIDYEDGSVIQGSFTRLEDALRFLLKN